MVISRVPWLAQCCQCHSHRHLIRRQPPPPTPSALFGSDDTSDKPSGRNPLLPSHALLHWPHNIALQPATKKKKKKKRKTVTVTHHTQIVPSLPHCRSPQKRPRRAPGPKPKPTRPGFQPFWDRVPVKQMFLAAVARRLPSCVLPKLLVLDSRAVDTCVDVPFWESRS